MITVPGITDDGDFTALVDARTPRADLVGAPANGVDEWLVMKGAEGGGLLDPEFIRELIAKSEPEASGREQVAMPNGITVSGSPAQIAAFIHAASVRKAEAEAVPVGKADLSTADLNDLPDSAFAYIEPGGKKDDEGKTTPRSLRHFAIHDKAHADAAAARIAQGAKFGDKAKAKVEAAQRKFGEKVSKDMGPELDGDPDVMDALDVTVPLAEPEEMAPGDPASPGSPAWESVDAASAQKWLSVAARLKNALCVLAEREMLEAASADPDDIENAWDLEDARCAVEYAIEQLAVFAACEQSEAELGAEMEAIGKALAAFDTAPLAVIEGLAEVRKAGRVLSAANEAAIRAAAESLQKVLASLPEAPVAKQAKQKGAAMPATAAASAPEAVAKETATPEAQAADTGPVMAGGTTGLGEPRDTGPAAALPGDGPQQARPGDAPGRTVVKSSLALVYDQAGNLVGVTDAESIARRVAKADGDGEKKAMQAVFDQDGDLIGIVDPDAIQPVTGAGGKPADDGDGEPQPGPAAAAADGDMTPQPPADAGTPAEEVGKAAAQDVITVTAGALESAVAKAVAAALGAMPPAQDVAKQADVAGALAQVEALEARIAKVEETPAAPRVFTNGQVPPAHLMRGQDQGSAQPVDVVKARALKETLYRGTAAEQNAAFSEMQEMAVSQLAAMQRR